MITNRHRLPRPDADASAILRNNKLSQNQGGKHLEWAGAQVSHSISHLHVWPELIPEPK